MRKKCNNYYFVCGVKQLRFHPDLKYKIPIWRCALQDACHKKWISLGSNSYETHEYSETIIDWRKSLNFFLFITDRLCGFVRFSQTNPVLLLWALCRFFGVNMCFCILSLRLFHCKGGGVLSCDGILRFSLLLLFRCLSHFLYWNHFMLTILVGWGCDVTAFVTVCSSEVVRAALYTVWRAAVLLHWQNRPLWFFMKIVLNKGCDWNKESRIYYVSSRLIGHWTNRPRQLIHVLHQENI